MTTDPPATTVAAVATTTRTLSHLVRHRIFFYLGVLIILLAFGAPSGGLIDIPISFFLKNKLHLRAHELANFRLVSAIPLYLSVVLGFIRDTWNPFGMRDRGFMLLFGIITAGLYIFFAFTPITYATLLTAVLRCRSPTVRGARSIAWRARNFGSRISARRGSSAGARWSSSMQTSPK